MVKPKPTTRAWLDSGRLCQINCKFCYYNFEKKEGYKTFGQCIDVVDEAIARGNDYIDISGGEPTLLPHLLELLQYIKKRNIGCCIISNALIGEKKLKKILDTDAVDDWLFSVHGTEEVHNEAVGLNTARRLQERFIKQVQEKQSFRMNCVINESNQHELLDIAKYMVQWKPRIVNFINFNPHGDWSRNISEAKKITANLRVVENNLNQAIELLEDSGIGVNVRYYPMCRIKEEYRRCVCNDLHVMFDPYEWDNQIAPKSFEVYKAWGVNTSKCIEFNTYPCNLCDLFKICGGINTAYNVATFGSMIDIVENTDIDKKDFYHYRKDNVLTLERRRTAECI